MSRQPFDSCSYAELTSCVQARIKWIREGREVLARLLVPSLADFSHTRMSIRMSMGINQYEIRRLLKMRRILKKSPIKNWDTDRHLRKKFCQDCRHMFYYDWYNCMSKDVNQAPLPKGLEEEDELVRILDPHMASSCSFFSARDEV